jgi:hypothetical protein
MFTYHHAWNEMTEGEDFSQTLDKLNADADLFNLMRNKRQKPAENIFDSYYCNHKNQYPVQLRVSLNDKTHQPWAQMQLIPHTNEQYLKEVKRCIQNWCSGLPGVF